MHLVFPKLAFVVYYDSIMYELFELLSIRFLVARIGYYRDLP